MRAERTTIHRMLPIDVTNFGYSDLLKYAYLYIPRLTHGQTEMRFLFQKRTSTPETSKEETQADDSTSSSDSECIKEAPPRFEYEGGNLRAVLVGLGAKSNLASSRITRMPFSWPLLLLLVALLISIAVLFTPQLLPKWLGFEWSTTQNLCENRTKKLHTLREKMDHLAGVPDGERFVNKAENALKCMQESARDTWDGLRNVRYPDECVLENAKTKTTKATVCVGGEKVQKCARLIPMLPMKCSTVSTPRVCREVVSTDEASAKRIAELRGAKPIATPPPVYVEPTQLRGVSEKADKTAERMMNRLIGKIDIANNCYIGYAILAIIAGAPLVVFRRNVTTRLLAASLSLSKPTFILYVVIALTVHDAVLRLSNDVDMRQLIRSFQNDPCYLDPKFSRARLSLISDTCATIAEQRAILELTLGNMSLVPHMAQLCEVCAVDGRGPTHDPDLVTTISSTTLRYAKASDPQYMYPATCNVTLLDKGTSVPPDSEISTIQAVLGSGVLAQMLLKGILTGWITHLFGVLAPMTQHHGQVELFGVPEDSKATLTKQEQQYARRFARDKHILPFILFSMFMAFEVAIIGYSFVESRGKSDNVVNSNPLVPLPNKSIVLETEYNCYRGELLPMSNL